QGDVVAAGDAIPDHVIDALWLHGDVESIRSGIRRYVRPEVTGIVVHLSNAFPQAADPDALADLLGTLVAP
ncbi:MAG: hypothetical protein ABW195_15705, partial [Ilumatobacteraceae bacterium]